jgi:hypothetical protein
MFLSLLLTVFLLAGCSGAADRPGPPREGAKGPTAAGLAPGAAAPEYHSPRRYWAVRHGDFVRGAVEFGLRECMLCHDAGRSCDDCHRYVGAPAVSRMPGGDVLPEWADE